LYNRDCTVFSSHKKIGDQCKENLKEISAAGFICVCESFARRGYKENAKVNWSERILFLDMHTHIDTGTDTRIYTDTYTRTHADTGTQNKPFFTDRRVLYPIDNGRR
jgi:hypothetical protein